MIKGKFSGYIASRGVAVYRDGALAVLIAEGVTKGKPIAPARMIGADSYAALLDEWSRDVTGATIVARALDYLEA